MSNPRSHLYRRLFSPAFLEAIAQRTDFWFQKVENGVGDAAPYRVVQRDDAFVVLPQTEADDGTPIAKFLDEPWALLAAAMQGAGRPRRALIPEKEQALYRVPLFERELAMPRREDPAGWLLADENLDLEAAEVAAHILRSPHRLAHFLDAAGADVLRTAVEILKDRHAVVDETNEPCLVGRYRLEVVCENEEEIEDAEDGLRYPSMQAAWLKKAIPKSPVEIGGGLYLDHHYRPIGYSLYTGRFSSIDLEPRQIFAPALLLNAGYVTLWHTHGMGPPKPSDADALWTQQQRDAGRVLGIQVLSSLVIGEAGKVDYVP